MAKLSDLSRRVWMIMLALPIYPLSWILWKHGKYFAAGYSAFVVTTVIALMVWMLLRTRKPEL